MVKFKSLLVIALVIAMAVVLSSGIFSSAAFDPQANIWLPRGTQPAFGEPGDTIRVEVRATQALPTTGWTATLENDVRSWNAEVVSVTTGRVRCNTEDGYIFQVKVPDDMPIELFTLVLKNGDKVLVSDRSVSVVEDLDASFYIMQVTDEHTNLEQANANGTTSSGKSSFDQKLWVRPTFNLINPRFIVYTGDNTQTYHAANNWVGLATAEVMLNKYRETLNGYTVPTVVLPGNHDIGWSDYVQINERKKQWESIIGARTYSFRMGAFYVNCCEFTLNDFYNWAVSDYNQAYSDPTVKYRLMLSHYLEGYNSWVTVAKADKPADLMIVGHGHQTKLHLNDIYPVLMLGASQANGFSGFYNFQKSGETWVYNRVTTRQNDVDYFNLYNGNYGAVQRVRAEYEKANDGTQTTNSVDITNEIRQNFYDGRVRFIMARGVYEVTGGEIVSQYDAGTNKTVVDVRVNIQAATASAPFTTTVEIEKVENSDNTSYPLPQYYAAPIDEETSEDPSEDPSEEPSEAPSEAPSEDPSESPSEAPSEDPGESSAAPSQGTSEDPSQAPSSVASGDESSKPGNVKTGDANYILIALFALTAAAAVIFVIRPKVFNSK